MKRKQPLVSVIMPVYNGEPFLRLAIDSILNQTYTNIELLIVDDGSKDASAKIIKEYEKRFFPLIKATYLKKHHGDSRASNVIFPKAKGIFIARMDADDVSHPQRIEKQVAYLLSHPQTIILGTQGTIINSHNHIIGHKNYPLVHKDIYRQFGTYNSMMHPSCMINTKLLPSAKRLYEDIYTIGDDYFTFFKLFQYGAFANLSESLHYYRIHQKNSSLKNPKKQFYLSVDIRKRAQKEYGYTLSFQSYFFLILQLSLVFLLPPKWIVPLYMLSRGMLSPKQLVKDIVEQWKSISLLQLSLPNKF